MNNCESDIFFMGIALDEAKKSLSIGEIPVGCAIVKEGEIISIAGNNREKNNDPSGHAEIIALQKAGEKIGSRSLDNCTMFVTLEPCPMCMSAIMLARISRLVFGVRDPKMGAVVSRFNLAHEPSFCHSIRITEGVLADECKAILDEFFARLREQ